MIPLTGEENKSYKLSDLINNLSGINNKECISCMERKKIKSRCEFVRFENNRLNYRCKECRTTKLINEVNKNFPITYQFCNGILINLLFC